MFNILKLHLKQNRTLLIAIVISFLLHSLLLNRFSLSLPSADSIQHIINIHLVKTPLPAKVAEPAIKNHPPLLKPQAQPKPIPDITPTPEQANAEPMLHAHAPVNEMLPPTAKTPPAPSMTETLTTESSASAEQAEAQAFDDNETSIADYFDNDVAEVSKPTPYPYLEIEYDVYRGTETVAAGVTKVIFSMVRNESYHINSVTEAKGLVSLFFDKLTQTSTGSVTERGLRPNHYQYQYGDDERRLQYADFAWSDGVIELNSSKGKKTEPLADGTQDLLSFMYQFMFSAPLSKMQLAITNGKNLRTYDYQFVGEEVITTKLGDLNTLHIVTTGKEDEKTELWLAIDYQFIPVKIRKTEKDGDSIEQIASKISTTRPD